MSSSSTIINFYEKIPKQLLSQSRNPHFKKHNIKIPSNIGIFGATGSMKTNCLMNLIYNMPDTFDTITVVTKNSDEPLYNYLKNKLSPDQLNIYEGVENIPDLDTFDKTNQNLVIFDDLVMDKQKKVGEYFIRCRKLNITCVWIAQSYFKTDKVIRGNLNYIILKKIASKRDLKLILSEYSIGIPIEVAEYIYNYALSGNKQDFLLIDLGAPVEKMFRKNLDEYLNPVGNQ